ncbi:MAG: efflux RND transporter periplasmic adaptor subunit, partial [Lachnospiraceae bacterium]|nr:efflux RND transporter periplasmic adaptor subunit [Lachnospiraceae bacterium]
PKEALVTKDDINYVFVAKDRKAVKTIVETGIKNGDYVEIVSGLNVDDILVWSDTKELKDGEEVRY